MAQLSFSRSLSDPAAVFYMFMCLFGSGLIIFRSQVYSDTQVQVKDLMFDTDEEYKLINNEPRVRSGTGSD